MKIILASGSPRRYDLLRQMGWDVKVHSLPFAEVETINDAKGQFENLRKQFLLPGQGSHIFPKKIWHFFLHIKTLIWSVLIMH